VAGRALRRKTYFLQGYDKQDNPTSDKRSIATYKFPPEYAHIIGGPFKLFKGGKTPTPRPVDVKPVYAVRDRTERYEITFPNIDGYRLDYPEGDLSYSFEGIENYEIDGSMLPTRTQMKTGIDGSKAELLQSYGKQPVCAWPDKQASASDKTQPCERCCHRQWLGRQDGENVG